MPEHKGSQNVSNETAPEISYEGAHFTMMQDSIIDNPDISQKAKLVYWKLARHAGKDSTSFPSITTIAEPLKMSRNTVVEAINELIELGLVTKIRRRSSNLYHIHFLPGSTQSMRTNTPQSTSTNTPQSMRTRTGSISTLSKHTRKEEESPPEFELSSEPDPQQPDKQPDTKEPEAPDLPAQEVNAIIDSMQETAQIYRERFTFSAKAREALREIIANFSGPITEQLFAEWLHTEGAGGESYKDKLNIKTIIETDFLRFADKHGADLIRQREVERGLEKSDRQKEDARFWAALIHYGETLGERRAAADATLEQMGHDIAFQASIYSRNPESHDFPGIIAANRDRFDALIADHKATVEDPFAEIRHSLEMSA